MILSVLQLAVVRTTTGGLAQLARAPALHAGGHRFESDILHRSLMLAKGLEVRNLTHHFVNIDFGPFTEFFDILGSYVR